MKEIVLFLMTFVFAFLLYELFIVRKAKKNKDYEPLEISYLVKKYNLDINRLSYNQLLQIIAIVSSFDISIIVSVILLFDNFIIEIVIGFITTLLVIFISYHFIYLFYKKKGMIKNE